MNMEQKIKNKKKNKIKNKKQNKNKKKYIKFKKGSSQGRVSW